MDKNRKTAYTALLNIEKNGAYSNLEINRQIRELRPDNPAFVRELVYGTIENRIRLEYILERQIPKGLKGIKKQVLVLLQMGLYQLVFMKSVPNYAAVSETVKLAKKLTPGREAFVNGVLRGCSQRDLNADLPDREADLIRYLSVRYSYEPWIVRMWISQYGEEKAERLLAAGNSRPNLSIRCNLLKGSREALAERLEKQGFQTEIGTLSPRVLFVTGSGILETEEYHSGLFSVQDQASVLAAELLAPEPGDTVLDVCAAPGGKTLAMAEMMKNSGLIKAFDIYRHKLTLLEKEAKRLGLFNITVAENDGSKVNPALAGIADRVLVDAPCSGLGVIRRKPEIKFKIIEDEGLQLAEKQLQILRTSAGYVKDGGRLLYSTCTINRRENEEVISKFLETNRTFTILSERQFLPDTDETDGFYVCVMEKRGRKEIADGGRL